MASRLGTLYYRLFPIINRKLQDDVKEELAEVFTKEEPEIKELLKAYNILNAFLDDLGVTKIDVKNKLGGNLIKRNHTQGWG